MRGCGCSGFLGSRFLRSWAWRSRPLRPGPLRSRALCSRPLCSGVVRSRPDKPHGEATAAPAPTCRKHQGDCRCSSHCRFSEFHSLAFQFVEANAAEMATLSMAIGSPNVARQIAVDVCMAGGRNFPMPKVTQPESYGKLIFGFEAVMTNENHEIGREMAPSFSNIERMHVATLDFPSRSILLT